MVQISKEATAFRPWLLLLPVENHAMSQELPDDHITKKTAVLRIPGMEDVTVRREVEYQTSDAGSLTMDLYSPPDLRAGEDRPAVISVAGYPDPGIARIFGRPYNEWGSSTSWARLIAASGMLGITYENREPATDVLALLAYLRANGTRHGVDAKRLGLLAVSGHSPLALSVLMERNARPPLCAALICPLVLDLDGFSAVADAAKAFRFASPTSGKTVDALPSNAALFIARAGEDQTPGLNETLDCFVAKAFGRNLELTVVNHPQAPHAFDVMQDSDASRAVIRAALAFLRARLLADPA